MPRIKKSQLDSVTTITTGPVTLLEPKDLIVDTTAGAVSITMPSAGVSQDGDKFTITRKGTWAVNAVSINPGVGLTLAGAAAAIIYNDLVKAVNFIRVGTDWVVSESFDAVAAAAGYTTLMVERVATVAPPAPAAGNYWVDTSAATHVLKQWSGSAWVVQPITAGKQIIDKGSFYSTRYYLAAGTVTPAQDDYRLGDIIYKAAVDTITGHVKMGTGNVSRTTYYRLLDAIAPLRAGGRVTAASTSLYVAGTDAASLVVGQVIEGTGIPLSTTITSVGAGVSTKVGTTVTGSNYYPLQVGQTPATWTVGQLVSGTGVPAGASVSTIIAESTQTGYVDTPTPYVYLAIGAVPPANVGAYVTGTGVALPTRTTVHAAQAVFGSVATPALAVNYASPLIAATGTYPPLIGYTVGTHAGLVNNTRITAVRGARTIPNVRVVNGGSTYFNEPKYMGWLRQSQYFDIPGQVSLQATSPWASAATVYQCDANTSGTNPTYVYMRPGQAFTVMQPGYAAHHFNSGSPQGIPDGTLFLNGVVYGSQLQRAVACHTTVGVANLFHSTAQVAGVNDASNAAGGEYLETSAAIAANTRLLQTYPDVVQVGNGTTLGVFCNGTAIGNAGFIAAGTGAVTHWFVGRGVGQSIAPWNVGTTRITAASTSEITVTGSITTGSAVITGIASTVGMVVGQRITTNSTVTNRYITALAATTITFSGAVSATTGAVTATGARYFAASAAGAVDNAAATTTWFQTHVLNNAALATTTNGAQTFSGRAALSAAPTVALNNEQVNFGDAGMVASGVGFNATDAVAYWDPVFSPTAAIVGQYINTYAADQAAAAAPYVLSNVAAIAATTAYSWAGAGFLSVLNSYVTAIPALSATVRGGLRIGIAAIGVADTADSAITAVQAREVLANCYVTTVVPHNNKLNFLGNAAATATFDYRHVSGPAGFAVNTRTLPGTVVVAPANVTCATTATNPIVLCSNTAGLVVGMAVIAAPFATRTHIITIVPNVSFTVATAPNTTNPAVSVQFMNMVTLSAVQTSAGAQSVTFGARVQYNATAFPASTTGIAGTLTFGAYSTLSAAPGISQDSRTASTTPLLSVQGIVWGGVTRATGVITAATGAYTATLGELLILNANTTGVGSTAVVTVGGKLTLNTPSTANGVGAAYTYGGGYTMVDALAAPSNATASAVGVTFSSASAITLSAAATATNLAMPYRLFPYGGGDGSTNFGLPQDAKGRVIGVAGAGAALTNRIPDVQVGLESVALAISEMPAHTHADTGHQHSPGTLAPSISFQTYIGAAGTGLTGTAFTSNSSAGGGTVGGGISGATALGNSVLSTVGGGVAHQNMQPTQFAAMSAQIYAGV